MTDFYVSVHVQQNDRNPSGTYRWGQLTATEGCTWTSLTNAIATTFKRPLSPRYVHDRVKRSEEQNPNTPGWHLKDAQLAAKRLGYDDFEVLTGRGFAALTAYHDAGYAILLQGDSDRFGNHTCSGVFDGLHCVMIHPQEDGSGRWLLYDPICGMTRYEFPTTLKAYGQKLATNLFFARFKTRVPLKAPPVWWASNIDPSITKAYTATAVAKKLRQVGVTNYGTAINYSDLEAGCRARGIDYGSSVQLIDVRALMRPGVN